MGTYNGGSKLIRTYNPVEQKEKRMLTYAYEEYKNSDVRFRLTFEEYVGKKVPSTGTEVTKESEESKKRTIKKEALRKERLKLNKNVKFRNPKKRKSFIIEYKK